MKATSSKRFMQFALCCALVLTMAFIGGCKGSSGSDGVGTNGTNGVDATQPVNGAPSATETLQASIISASVTTSATGGSLVVSFKLLDEKGAPIDPRNVITAGGRCRFFVAQIDATGNYKNYLTSSSGAPTYDSASSPSVATAATSTYFAPTATPGVYTFTFSKDITAKSFYDATLTHTVAAQISRTITSSKGVSFAQNVNPYFNFRPDGAAVTVTREVVAISNCNECHGTLTGHGSRVETALCILCHNPGVVDPTTGNSVDFKSMIHKIHMGANLPSNKAGAAFTVGSTAFSDVVWPSRFGDSSFNDNKPMNCTKCHKAGKDAKGNTYGADVDKWKATPVIANCVTCHDLTTFDLATSVAMTSGATATTVTAVKHTGSASAKADGSCAGCHDQTESLAMDGALSVQAVHVTPMDSSLNSDLVFAITSVEPAALVSGSTVTVHFTVKTAAGADYTLTGGGVVTGTPLVGDSVTMVLGYMTGADYDNTTAEWIAGQSYVTGKSKTVSSATSATKAGTTPPAKVGTEYVVSFGTVTVPAAAGVGTIAVYGKQGITVPTNSATAHRTAAQKITGAFGANAYAIYNFDLTTGAQKTAAADIRRVVVTMDKCNACHNKLNVHSRPDTKICVICHAPNLTYINSAANGSDMNSGNFKNMIHAYHGTQTKTTGKVLFKNVEAVGYPNDPRNCLACHVSDPMAALTLPTGVKSSLITATTQTSLTGGTSELPLKAACTSCHDSDAAKAHADLNQSAGVETCAVCHASGNILGNTHAPVR